MAPIASNNFYHSANMFTSTGVHTTGNDPKADELYQAAATELDEAKAKKNWQEMMKYAYDVMWVNIGLVNMPTNYVVGPNLGELVINQHRPLAEAYVGFKHKA